MIRITVYAGPSETHPASTVQHDPLPERNVVERLHAIGLEYKTADYFPQRMVVITLEPVKDNDGLEETMRKIKALLDD